MKSSTFYNLFLLSLCVLHITISSCSKENVLPPNGLTYPTLDGTWTLTIDSCTAVFSITTVKDKIVSGHYEVGSGVFADSVTITHKNIPYTSGSPIRYYSQLPLPMNLNSLDFWVQDSLASVQITNAVVNQNKTTMTTSTAAFIFWKWPFPDQPVSIGVLGPTNVVTIKRIR